jgi:hypothetical protein
MLKNNDAIGFQYIANILGEKLSHSPKICNIVLQQIANFQSIYKNSFTNSFTRKQQFLFKIVKNTDLNIDFVTEPVVSVNIQLGLASVGSVTVMTSLVSLISWMTNLGKLRLIK